MYVKLERMKRIVRTGVIAGRPHEAWLRELAVKYEAKISHRCYILDEQVL